MKIGRRDFIKYSLVGGGYLQSLSNNLSIVRVNRAEASKRVTIIGAGLAGLTAGYELQNLGYDLTLFEASNRAGGRVYTLRHSFSNGLYAEAGGMFIADRAIHVKEYARIFNIPLVPYDQPTRGSLLYYFQGLRFKLSGSEKLSFVPNLNNEEKELGMQGLWSKYVYSVVDPLLRSNSWYQEIIEKYDRISFYNFLKDQGASNDAISLLRLGYLDTMGDGIQSVSAAQFLREFVLERFTRQYYVVRGGTDLLTEAFARKLKQKIVYDSVVVKIKQNPQSAVVTISKNGTHESLSADYVICAIPFSVLKSVEFSPPLSDVKQRAIAELAYTSVGRLFLESKEKFWRKEGVSGEAYVDLPIMRVLEHPLSGSNDRGILEAFTSGSKARDLAALAKDKQIEFALEHMEKVHPEIRRHFCASATYFWDNNPWAKGAYCWFKPGQLKLFSTSIAEPEGRIFFAGEHTSSLPARMEGAIESGYRAAMQVHEEITRNPENNSAARQTEVGH